MKQHIFQSGLGRALGRGSAKSGHRDWLRLRIAAAALIILGGWFLWSIGTLAHADYFEARAWLSAPHNAAGVLLLIWAMFTHAWLGAREIVEDYISCPAFKNAKLLGMLFFFAAGGVFACVCVLKVAFGG